MRIGYPCINRSISCQGNRTFRLISYSPERLIETVQNNLDCLGKILRFNAPQQILFFRITSDLVPFASHPVCTYPWQKHFRKKFREIGNLIQSHGMRISMHPDQFTLINSLDPGIFERSKKELAYHTEVLDLLGLDGSAKIQIHVGGVYGDREKSVKRFIERYARLDQRIKRRLVVENDDRNYTLKDCLRVHGETGIPVLFDVFHHQALSSGETLREALRAISETWRKKDGIPMVDYSSQKKGERRGVHAESIELRNFKRFLLETGPLDFDMMLEIKDKERSALKAIKVALRDRRFRKKATSHRPKSIFDQQQMQNNKWKINSRELNSKRQINR